MNCENTTTRLEFGESPLLPYYGQNGEESPMWESETNNYMRTTGTCAGVPYENGPTNWGGNESEFYWQVGDVRIQSLDRHGRIFKDEDLAVLRTEFEKLRA